MITVTGLETNTTYYLNPNDISSFYYEPEEKATLLYTNYNARGAGKNYLVTESPDEILDMILSWKQACLS